LRVLTDFQGRGIRLTDERLAHIYEHPEMIGQDHRIEETLSAPDSIVLSNKDPTVHLYHRFFADTPVSPKYLVVVVKFLNDDAFIITAFFTDKEKKGVRLWKR